MQRLARTEAGWGRPPTCYPDPSGYLLLAINTEAAMAGGKRKTVHKYPANRRDQPDRIPASTFKDSCLQLLDRVQQTREEIVVTKYGRPVAKLVAFEEGAPTLFGMLAGSVTVSGDIVAPMGEEWDAEG